MQAMENTDPHPEDSHFDQNMTKSPIDGTTNDNRSTSALETARPIDFPEELRHEATHDSDPNDKANSEMLRRNSPHDSEPNDPFTKHKKEPVLEEDASGSDFRPRNDKTDAERESSQSPKDFVKPLEFESEYGSTESKAGPIFENSDEPNDCVKSHEEDHHEPQTEDTGRERTEPVNDPDLDQPVGNINPRESQQQDELISRGAEEGGRVDDRNEFGTRESSKYSASRSPGGLQKPPARSRAVMESSRHYETYDERRRRPAYETERRGGYDLERRGGSGYNGDRRPAYETERRGGAAYETERRGGSAYETERRGGAAYETERRGGAAYDTERRPAYDTERRPAYDTERRGGYEGERRGGAFGDRGNDSERRGIRREGGGRDYGSSAGRHYGREAGFRDNGQRRGYEGHRGDDSGLREQWRGRRRPEDWKAEEDSMNRKRAAMQQQDEGWVSEMRNRISSSRGGSRLPESDRPPRHNGDRYPPNSDWARRPIENSLAGRESEDSKPMEPSSVGGRNHHQASRNRESDKEICLREDQVSRVEEQGVRVCAGAVIEITVNDRLGKKARIKCSPQDTIIDVKKLASAILGVRPEKMRFQRDRTILKDHIALEDYEVKHGMNIDLYYN